MQTKLSQLKAALAQGDTQTAIKIAAKFPNLGKERNAILDAHLAITNPRWISGLGKDIEHCIQAGVAALYIRYSI